MSNEIKSNDGPVDKERFTSYLATLPAIAANLPIQKIERVGQGQSNLTYRITLREGAIILRRPPMGPLPPSAHDVLREYRVLDALQHSAVPVPRPLAACQDVEILGAPFYLMEMLSGDAIHFMLPPALAAAPASVRHDIGIQVIDTLAQLHSINPLEIGLGDLGRPTGYIARQLKRWKSQLDYTRTRPVPDLDWATDWLAQHQPADVTQPAIVHGDYKLDNLLFALEPPARLRGVVDWEMATLGDPLADLGWLLAFWREADDPAPELRIAPRVTEQPGFPTRAELAQRYSERMQRSLPDLNFYIVLAMWKLAILLEGHWARHIAGTADDFNFAYLEESGPIFAAGIRRMTQERH